jgi:diacylglycerol O-acyltransferase / wax synthase
MAETLTALDATFLELEQHDAGALMSIGGVMVFDPLPDGTVPTLEAVQSSLAHRLGVLPRYSERLSQCNVGGLSWPHWVPDPSFDISNHVTRATLPSPGGGPELCEWTAELFSHPLDRARPLWRIVLLEGLADGRWALAQQTHHCLVDGVGSVDVLALMLDPKPHPRAPGRSARYPAPPASRARLQSLSDHAQPLTQATVAGVKAGRTVLNAAVHPREAFDRSRGLAELLVRDELVGAPHTSLNVPIGQGRRFAVVRASLAELKRIAHGLGGSVNDAVLAACTSALRDLLVQRGERLPSRGLRAMVPVNVRAAADALSLGNKVSSLFVELPVAEPLALVRFRAIAAGTQHLKSSQLGPGASAFVELAELAPPALHAALARSAYATRLFNVTITNVPGPQQPLYALGARMRELLPFVPLAAGHSVGIAVFSYDGQMTFGISADRASTPDLATLRAGIEAGIEELLELLPDHRQHETEKRP